MRYKVFSFLLTAMLSLVFLQSRAGEIVLVGTYQGKNLYVQNPFTGNMQDFCTEEVLINNTKISMNLNSSAFEIDLSHFKLNDEISIKIRYKSDCKPKVLNGSVIKASTHFHFVAFNINEKNINWSTTSEKLQGKFYIEQFLHNTWVAISEVQSKGGLAKNDYASDEHHHSGLNKYRIRFREPDGQFFYSKVAEFNSTKAPITFTPKKVVNVINLSQNAHYEILDANGISLIKGSGVQISVANLKVGEYFINLDNRTEKFTKH